MTEFDGDNATEPDGYYIADRLQRVVDARSLSAFVAGLRSEAEVSDTRLDIYLEQLAAYLIDASDGELRKYDSVSPEAVSCGGSPILWPDIRLRGKTV